MKKLNTLLICLFLALQCGYAATYYVATNGDDNSGDGSSARPWRTLRAAVSKVPANQGHTIKIGNGTFVETGFINVPTGVNIEGSGIGVTILKPSPALYHQSYAWLFDKFLLNLSGGGAGNQSVKNLTIDGDNKRLYGGIGVVGRNNVLIQGVRVQYTYFTGIWMWETLDCRVTQSQLKDCAWGSTGGASGSIMASRSERLEIDHLDIDEAYGQAMDAVGSGKMYDLKVHHNRFSVSPRGNWATPGGNVVPNLAVEFYNVTLRNVQVYDNYFDNNFSIAMDEPQFATPTGVQTIRVYNNTFDLISRAGGSGFAIELTAHDVEIDHNIIYGGSTGIANWDASPNPHTMQNWKIHHNVFYGIASYYPTAIIAMYRHGVINAHIYNNTVETTGNATVNFIEVNNGGVARNVRIENNLIIDSNSSYQWYPNKFISLVNNASMQNSTARNNHLQKMAMGSVPGVSYSGNLSGDPQINRSGNRPKPYYELRSGSPLIDKGVNTGHPFSGNAPDIGALESGGSAQPTPNEAPSVRLTSPANGGATKLGTTITLTAEASDSDGSVSKVQFFQGSTLLGEDTSSPYSFNWTSSATGSFVLTAKAIDNGNATGVSSPVNFTITSSAPPTVSLTTPANNSTVDAGSSVTLSANAADTDGSITKVEFFQGSTKLGEDTTSPYSYTWENLVTGNYQLTARATDNSGITTTSSIVTINVAAGNALPTIHITKPANKATFTSGSDIIIEVFATDKDGQITKVEFFNGTTKLGEDTSSPHVYEWKNVPAGSYTITTKTYDNRGASGVSEPITVVVSGASNTTPTVSITSPANNASFAPGSPITIAAKTEDNDGTISKVEFYAGATKLGETTNAPYNFVWNNPTTGSYVLTAKAFDDKGASQTSGAVTVVVSGSNMLPTVKFTAPLNNDSFDEGSDIFFQVFATDKDGQITKVEFYNGDQKLHEDTTSPHNFTWTNVPAGTHQLTARTFDNHGASGTSAPLTITVNGSNLLPSVEFTAPLDNASFEEGSNIVFEVLATDKDGQITKVEFYDGDRKLHEDTTSPHNFTWTSVPAGTYQLTAKTYDNKGASGISVPLTITVTGSNMLPTVEFTTPQNNASFDEGSDIFLQVFATDKDGQITKVEFYDGDKKLHEDTTSPHNFTWSNAPAGTYHLTAMTYDNKGASGTSTPLTITVKGSNMLPTVEFRTPQNNASFEEGSNIFFEVFATDRDGQIVKVEFYNGDEKLYEDTTSPHNFTWTNVQPGTYQLTAKTYDNKGASGTSTPLTVSVRGSNLQPTVEFTTPQNNASFEVGSDIFFQVFATDKDGQIIKVEFYNGDEMLYEDTTSPHNFTWTDVPAGVYQLTAKTFDNKGASGTSAPLTIIVEDANSTASIARFFTPNNDGINDTWEWPQTTESSCHVTVYDQSGKVVFVSTSYESNWDGTADGKQLPEGAYIYVGGCGEHKIKGAVRIIR